MNNTELLAWVDDKLSDNQDFKSDFTKSDLHKIIGCIDLTTLNATDSNASVTKFVENGLRVIETNSLPNVAAICVFSNFTKLVRTIIKHTDISTACVATAFPHGQADLESKVLEVANAEKVGATDIDVVINRGMVLDGDYSRMGNEVNAFSKASNTAHLKVILEVCELNLEQVYLSSKVAIENGADFIKTSTGKGESGASLSASLVMCLAIKEHFEKTGKMIGFKAAGGISTSDNAMQYCNLVNHVLGENWLNKTYFRIGASSLLGNIVKDLN